MGLNLCNVAMSDGEIRDKIKRQQSDIPNLTIKRYAANGFTAATPPPNMGWPTVSIPQLKGYFHITEINTNSEQDKLDLD